MLTFLHLEAARDEQHDGDQQRQQLHRVGVLDAVGEQQEPVDAGVARVEHDVQSQERRVAADGVSAAPERRERGAVARDVDEQQQGEGPYPHRIDGGRG